MNASRSTLSLFAIMIAALGLTGCACKNTPRAFNVEVEAGAGMLRENGAAQVHVIGVNNMDLSSWEQRSVDGYWEGIGSSSAGTDPDVFVADVGVSPMKSSVRLASSDPKWGHWIKQRGATHLVVIGNVPKLPGPDFRGAKGPADPRCMIFPIGSCWWESGDDRIHVVVEFDKLRTSTNPLPTPRE